MTGVFTCCLGMHTSLLCPPFLSGLDVCSLLGGLSLGDVNLLQASFVDGKRRAKNGKGL